MKASLYFTLLLVLISLLGCTSGSISEKGRKLAEVEEDLFSFEDEDEENTNDDEGDDFFDDMAFEEFGDEDDSSLFDEMSPEDCIANNGTNCTLPEPKYPDVLLQQLLRQTWGDFKSQIALNGSVSGLPIDPLDVDSQLKEPIKVSQTSASYSADVEMDGIKIYGLSTINLTHCSVLRNENLTDLSAELTFHFSELLLNGSYALKGTVGWWQLDSQGRQDFNITLLNATIGFQVDLVQITDPDEDSSAEVDAELDWSVQPRLAVPAEAAKCHDGDVIVTKLGFPLRYDDIDFRFNNLGAFANTMVNGVGIYFLQTQEVAMIDSAKSFIQKSMASLLCNNY